MRISGALSNFQQGQHAQSAHFITPSIRAPSPMVITSLDFDKPGKQHGFLQVPCSHNLSGWANIFIPTTIVSRGSGPTVLALGGNHGDEYQGQIALMKLARELEPD